ncbi:MAG: hypothetical protein PHF57_09310 [Methanoregula sp.]|jgi:hypothetical protein|nr:hypothetical protein [Methanoregula sp.]
MNEADLENKFSAILRELERMNKTLEEIRDLTPKPAQYTLMEK